MTPVEERIDHDPEIVRRFWAKVDKRAEGGCWQWLGAASKGYGFLTVNGSVIRAHRFAYEFLVGPIPEGLQLDHLCRNPGCVNPEHLEPVTGRENTLRGVGPTARNAAKTYCKHGHEFTPENTRWKGLDKRERECVACYLKLREEATALRSERRRQAHRPITERAICLGSYHRVSSDKIGGDLHAECPWCKRRYKVNWERELRKHRVSATESAQPDYLCECGHHMSNHGPEGCEVEISDVAPCDCSCRRPSAQPEE